MQSCLDGHPEDYRHLVRRYQGVLLSYLTGLLGSRSGAEEAAQETFVRAYFVLGKLKKPGSFFSWLLGIAARVAKEHQRAGQRDRRIGREVFEMSSTAGTAPGTSADLSLARAIAQLPETWR
ncbi:MAG TPA: RNA polymerase sigma factor, partial [Planctomycetota bacterium]|nr:RNA polymerase sigma factor [Planctomycetota bacterium]